MNRPNTSPSSPFSADRPLDFGNEPDLLGRAPFAHSIARAILGWHGRESLVIALYGGWGEGKSSVMAMVRHHLHVKGKPIPIQITFNPWEWSGQNQLAKAFFDEIGLQLERHGVTESNPTEREVGSDLRELGRILHNIAEIGAPLGRVASVLLPPTAAFWVAASELLKAGSRVVTSKLEFESNSTTSKQRSVYDVKQTLKERLGGLNNRIVVFIDDIDRLAADEIRLLFQLIKANSDFPNLVFFLAFQRDVIEKALESTIRTGSGGDFLEKIVQVPLNLPLIQPEHLRREWIHMVHGILETRGFASRYSPDTAGYLWDTGIRAYVRSLRDLNRLRSSFDFHLGLFEDPDDVDARDLLVLEVLRVFEPTLYSEVIRNFDPFGNDTPPEPEEPIHPQGIQNAEELHALIERAQVVKGMGLREAAYGLLSMLLPEDRYRSPEFGERDRRPEIHGPRFYLEGSRMRYLHFGLPESEITQADRRALSDSLDRPAAFCQRLRQLAARGLLLQALDLCEILFEPNPEQGAKLLFTLDDSIIESQRRRSQDDLAEGQLRVLQSCLRHIALEPRWLLVQSSIRWTENLRLAATFIKREDRLTPPHEPNTASSPHLRERIHLDVARSNWLARVQEQSAKPGFAKNPSLHAILATWLEWAPDRMVVREWAANLVDKPDGYLILAKAFFHDHPMVFFGSDQEQRLSCLGKLIYLDDMRGRLARLRKDQVDRATETLIDRFEDACERFSSVFRLGCREGSYH